MKQNSQMTVLIAYRMAICAAKADNDFTYMGSLNTARYAHKATMLHSSKVLVAGGAYGVDIAISSAELYDPSVGIWTNTRSLSNARLHYTLTLLPNGKVLAAGGLSSGNYLSSAELYDPNTRIWTVTGSLARYPTAL